MVIIKNGDLLEAEEDILVHQVNIAGIMGGGIAKQIAAKYPKTERDYIKYCEEYNFSYLNLQGKCFLTKEKSKYIANIFSQNKNFNTDYTAMEKALTDVRKYAKKNNLSVAMPYKIGCGIANGEWELVLDVINKVFKDYEVNIYKLKV